MGAISGWKAELNHNYLREGVERMQGALHSRDGGQAIVFENASIAIACIRGDGREYGEATRWIVALDGELYNRAELLEALDDVPPREDESDHGLVLRAYRKWGLSFVSRLLGAFALAVWDESEGRLVIARDQLGAKPLFYATLGGGLSFASEVKGLLAAPGQTARLEPDGLCALLALGPARSPQDTVFAGIEALAPGHMLVYDGHHHHTRCYWNVRATPFVRDADRVGDDLLRLVRDATHRMPADAALLSGGLDSSLVCALRREEIGDAVLRTFSVEYEGNEGFKPSAYQPGDDRPFIDRMVDVLGAEHRIITLSPASLADALLDAMRARDMPGMADIDSSLLLLCREVKSAGVDVVLSGECADELLGGYPWYHRADLFSLNTFPWSHDWTLRKALLKPDVYAMLDLEGYAARAYEKSIDAAPLLAGETPEQIHRRQLFYLCREYFMQTLLERGDRMGTRAGVTIRMPFCDPRIAEYAYNVPWEVLAYDGREKGALRKGSEGVLPDDVLWRKKSPFPKTVNPAFARAVAGLLSDMLDDRGSPLHALIDERTVRGWIADPFSDAPPWYGQLMGLPQMLGMLVQMGAWLREYRISLPL